MKFLKLLTALVFIILIGGAAYFAFTEVPVQQEEVSKEIPNERFFND